MKPTLYILAAGMGSRYGGLKQLEKVGPNGETLIDYSIYDALKAGFKEIVFVIRQSFEKDFNDIIVNKYKKLVPIKVICQKVDDVPAGIKINPVREKPWGSAQALLAAKGVINEAFGVINGDDFYGLESFQLLIGQIAQMKDTQYKYAMIPYRVGNTLVESGAVARAVCEIDAKNYLTKIVERTEVMRIDGVPSYQSKDGEWKNLTDTMLVSMNMWAFTPDIFDLGEEYFKNFLEKNKDDVKAEYLLPTLVNSLVQDKKVKVKAINTPSNWFGITYQKDIVEIKHKIGELVASGKYPSKLF